MHFNRQHANIIDGLAKSLKLVAHLVAGERTRQKSNIAELHVAVHVSILKIKKNSIPGPLPLLSFFRAQFTAERLEFSLMKPEIK